MPIEPKSERDARAKILNIKSSPPLAETIGLLRGALQVWVFLPVARPTQTGQIERLLSSNLRVLWGMPVYLVLRQVAAN
jgi:hypothetical protein